LRTDHLSRKNKLQCATFSNQPRQALRSTAAWKESQGNFRLAKLGVLRGYPDGTSHCRFAAATEGKAIDCCNHWLCEILDEIQDRLSEAARLLRFDGRYMREFVDISSGDEGFVARSGENNAPHCSIVFCVLECGSEVIPGWRIQGVEDLGTIE